MRMEHPQRVHSDCLLVPSESTLSRKEGHTRRPEGPRTHHEQSTVSPWVMVQSACLAGAWCGNVIPGVNTGLLTSEGCSPPWTPHSRKETHFDAPRSDGKTCKACRVHTHAACIGTAYPIILTGHKQESKEIYTSTLKVLKNSWKALVSNRLCKQIKQQGENSLLRCAGNAKD